MNEKQLESKETIEEVEELIKEDMSARIKLNRAQRRAAAKKLGKKGRANADLIAETAEKLNYIDLIQQLRKLNKEKENEENGNYDSSED